MKSATFVFAAVLTSMTSQACIAQSAPVRPANEATVPTLRQRAQAGDVRWMGLLGRELLNDGSYGAHDDEGLVWLRRAAESGDWASEYYLAQMYLYGWRPYEDEDPQEGVRWLRMAAENVPPNEKGGDVYFLLGHIYSGIGIPGLKADVPVDDTEAIKWYRLCVLEYSSFCELRLGTLLLKSPATAVEGYKWLHHAATHGEPQAMYDLGEIFASGGVVQQDLVQALAWYESARKWSIHTDLTIDSNSRIEDVSKALSPAEVGGAHRIAAEFQPVKLQ